MFAFKSMFLRLCNMLATFQCCMMSIFSGIVEDIIELFIDYFSIVGDSFENCPAYLASILRSYEESNLFLKWEKGHCMVKKDIARS